LEDAKIALFFDHYITSLASWYDLSDASLSFATNVPHLALRQPLLFDAVIALSAMHLHTTTRNQGHRAVAESYHQRCVRRLIELQRDDELVSGGVALAATCLLRSYEILGGKSSRVLGGDIH
jgi:hypothetical protein